MISTIDKTNELEAILNDIPLGKIDKSQLISAIDNIKNSNNVVYIENEDIYNKQIKSINKKNKLRLFDTKIYISLSQIKQNLKNICFATIIEIISSHISADKGDSITSALTNILPSIISCVHIISDDEMCVFLNAIDLYLLDERQSKAQNYHSPEEFAPYLFEGYCDRLTTRCVYRTQNACNIKLKNIFEALNHLEEKHILERDQKTNEYRYKKW